MTTPSYPVDTDCWLPVLTARGEHDTLSLREVMLRAHELRDIAVPIPPAASAVLRVLYVLAARISALDTAPDSGKSEDWLAHRRSVVTTGRFRLEAVNAYFDAHRDRWDLFSPTHPWMQDPQLLDQARQVGINRLDPTRPRDNSPVWFKHTHHGHAPAIPTPEAILWLLTTHQYGPGGGGGTRTVTRREPDGSERTVSDQYMSSGPLRAALTHYPLGRTLFETLVLGIPDPTAAAEPGRDVAPWERDELPDPLGPPPPITSPAGLLLGRSRHALLLHPDHTGDFVVDARITWAFKQPHPPLAGNDPYTIRERDQKDGWRDRRADADRALWRDLDALLADSDHHTRPDTVRSIQYNLPPAVRDNVRVRAHGVDQDRQASDRQWFTATTPPLFAWLAEQDRNYARGAELLRTAAETVAGVLRSALSRQYRSLGIASAGPAKGDVPWVATAMTHYWPRAEDLFWEYFHRKDFAEPVRAFTVIAEEATVAATSHEAHQPAVARAQAGVLRYLRNHAAKKEPRKDKDR
ncbi:type I-E CRISPR-associated protein Cse1/CasA [Saccharothrix longispora]|uniref:type I-E CRISPR-associated protein Cse1/CasA n=1 Tax=Saccharothrix longispora TaxID=33920 RepID=UPI0028FD206E|nr:type I-E CRISPR-associated protein Cse1/CasA [Saccharothrix longispora]MDU0289569.1 type I-E CRISPR-associated protein Cse1/CasA [Saccharothrix longispora]